MPAQLNPYISFAGNAREALTFYQSVFGGELRLNTFGEFGQSDAPFADQIMHGQLQAPNGFALMGADTPPGMEYTPGSAITVSLSGDAPELRDYWNKLSEGGTVSIPLQKQIWGDEFGQCIDRFGVPWLVNIAGADAGAAGSADNQSSQGQAADGQSAGAV